MKFLIHECSETTGPLGWYESSVDIVPGNTIAIPGGKTFTVDSKALNKAIEASGAISPAEPIKQACLYCTPSTVAAEAPGVIRLTVGVECEAKKAEQFGKTLATDEVAENLRKQSSEDDPKKQTQSKVARGLGDVKVDPISLPTNGGSTTT
jgi:hypothetical protein